MKTVKKGTNRASAAAKTRKHAQQTPLPNPKSRKDAAEVVAEAKKINGSKVSEERLTKAQAFLAFAKEAGWTVQLDTPSKISEMVVAEKDGEAITIWFVNNKLDGANMPVYSSGDRRIQLKNVSAAKKQISGTNDRPVRELKRVARRSSKEVKAGTSVTRLFDPQTASDQEVLDALHGQRITWYSTLLGATESARIDRDLNDKFYRITEHPKKPAPEERVLHFVSRQGGFRSVSLKRIVQVR